jgi:hypothetical protein
MAIAAFWVVVGEIIREVRGLWRSSEDSADCTQIVTMGMGVWLTVLGGLAISAQDKYDAKVPGGLAMSEFRGYEDWQAISMSRNEKVVAMILGNPAMISAYRAGIPGNGEPVPDGAKMAKVHWIPKPNQFFPNATVPGNLLNVDFMMKDSKRFARRARDPRHAERCCDSSRRG